MQERAAKVLAELLAGNERFRKGQSLHYRYPPDQIANLAVSQHPKACIIACSDSRVTPEIVFDQPLGELFVARVPGNVCADSAKWCIDIAVAEMKVPLVMVMGHTGCLAVGQVVRGQAGEGGPLRLNVMAAMFRAQARKPEDLYLETVNENACVAIEQLARESAALRQALQNGITDGVASVYDMDTGLVSVLPHQMTW